MSKKIGSVYEDIIKPLEEEMYESIRQAEKYWRGYQDAEKPHLRNVLYDSDDLLAYAPLREHVPKIAEFVASFIVEHDAIFRGLCTVMECRVASPQVMIAIESQTKEFLLQCFSNSLIQKSDVPYSCERIEAEWQAYLRGEIPAQDILNLLKEQGQENKLLKSAPSIKVLTEDAIRGRLRVVSESAGKTPHFSLSEEEELEDLNSSVGTLKLHWADMVSLGYKIEVEKALQDDDNIIDPSKLKSADTILKEWSEAPDYMGEDTLEKDNPVEKNEWKDRLPSCEIKLHKPAPPSEIDRDLETDMLLANLSQRRSFFLHSGEKTMGVFVVNIWDEKTYWCEISDKVRVPIPFGVLYATIKFIREKGSIHEHLPIVEVLDDWVKAVHRDLVSKRYIDLNKISWAPNGEGTFSTGTMDLKFVYFMASKCYGVTGW